MKAFFCVTLLLCLSYVGEDFIGAMEVQIHQAICILAEDVCVCERESDKG